MEQKTTDTPTLCLESHNLVTYVAPRLGYANIAELVCDPAEKALAENAIWWFLDNAEWSDRDRVNLRKAFERKGWNMFIWKYYAAARCYIGGYKALSAHLKLRRSV